MIVNKELQSIVSIVLLVCMTFMTFYLVVTFPTYFAGFFFGLLSYASFDAYLKKDL